MSVDIFDIPPIWKTDPIKAFDAFVGSAEFVALGKHGRARKSQGLPVHPLNAQSAQVYRHMFANFIRWLDQHRSNLHEVTEHGISLFLEAKEEAGTGTEKRLNSLIRMRYLRLLERVYQHLGVQPNPATKAAYAIHRSLAVGRDKPKAYLNEHEQIVFLSKLPEPDPYDPDRAEAPSWKRRRDRAMLAMMLGAGLKVSEVINLRLDSIGKKDATGSIPIRIVNPALRSADNAHKTMLRAFATKYVLPWIEERNIRKVPGKLVFPASLKEGKPLNKATVYRHVKAVFADAGLDVERMGGRTLRNSFAVRELAHDTPIELVGQFLGHAERRSTEKYIISHKQKKILGEE